MIERKLYGMLMSQFNIISENLQDEGYLLEDLGIDMVDLAMALEETFALAQVEDLSNLETLGDLVDYVQSSYDQSE